MLMQERTYHESGERVFESILWEQPVRYAPATPNESMPQHARRGQIKKNRVICGPEFATLRLSHARSDKP